MKVRALIVEDELLARETLRDFAGRVGWLEIIGEASDGAAAVKLINELRPGLIFLDVQMPVFTGLQVLELIKHQPFVVFTTAFDDYAVSAFEFGALDYLLKPFGLDRFIKSLERVKRHLDANQDADDLPSAVERAAAALERINPEPLARLFVRDARGRIVQIQMADVLRLRASDDYVEIHTGDKFYLINSTLNDFEQRLDSTVFRRIHRSHIVNLKHVKSIETYDRRILLRLSNNSEIVSSRTGAKVLKETFLG